MYDADKDNFPVITNKELFFLVGIFVFILIQLYPKNILQKIIKDDHSDYALTMVYLKDLLKHHPDDEMLNLVYLEKKMQVRDINGTLDVAKKLMQSDKEYIRDKATLLSFNAEMIKYFQTKDENEKRRLYHDLQKLFAVIFVKKLYDDDAKKWYAHATFVRHDRARYYFLKKLLQKDPTNVDLLKNAYFLALKFGKDEEAQRYLDALQRYDKSNPQQWAMEKYYALLRYGKYKDAQLVLEQNANRSIKIKKELASFYLMRSMYKKASQLYLEIAKEARTKKERDLYIKKAIRALQSGNLLKEASALAHKYETQYINDKAMRNFILRIYLAAGRLDWADRYAKKILQHSYKGIQ